MADLNFWTFLKMSNFHFREIIFWSSDFEFLIYLFTYLPIYLLSDENIPTKVLYSAISLLISLTIDEK